MRRAWICPLCIWLDTLSALMPLEGLEQFSMVLSAGLLVSGIKKHKKKEAPREYVGERLSHKDMIHFLSILYYIRACLDVICHIAFFDPKVYTS